MELPEDSTVGNLLNRIQEQAGQRRGYLGEFKIGGKDLAVVLNGKSVEIMDGLATFLKDDDEVVIMQLTAGG